MTLLNFVLFVVLLVGGLCEESFVVSLDVDNYHTAINNHSDIIIKHYTSFCHHCKELQPIYEEIAMEMKEKYPNLVVAEIDVAENPKIGRELNLQGVPFICYYKNGKRIDYPKGKSKQDIVEFIETIITVDENQAVQSLMEKKAASVQEGIAQGEFVIVVFYPESEAHILKMVDKAISEIENSRRISVVHKEVADLLDVPFPSIVLYQKGQEKKQYKGELSFASFHRWLLVEELPLIIPYTPTYSRKVFHKELKMDVHIMFFAPSSLPQQSKLIVERIASHFRGRLVVLHIPSENHLLLDYFGVKEWEVPTIGIVHYHHETQKKYLLRDPLTYENALSFIQQFYKGGLTRIMRSEEEPVENRGPVYKVVGTTFEQFVFDPTKDVVVKFYASWCGKSKDFEPIYEEVAMQYIRDQSILFTEFEATKNEVDGINITEFPTVILYKAGGNGRSSVIYTGTRELDDFKAFLEANHELRNPQMNEDSSKENMQVTIDNDEL